MKGYVIIEKNFEYNDEYYYEGEGGGGTPEHVYTDHLKAEQELSRLERDKWRGEQPGQYSGEFTCVALTDNEDEEEVGQELARIFPNLVQGKPSKRQKRKVELQTQLARTLS